MTIDPASQPVRPDTARALLARVARAQVDGRAPSLSVGVVRDGALVWSAGRGSVAGVPPTTDTQYRIGSITKGFTAVLIMRLRDEGRLGLEDRVDQHLPGTVFGDRVIGDLLAHAGGLAAEPPGPWWERSTGQAWSELAASFSRDLVLGPPGGFHYSNPGYALLGEIVARHRDRSWYDALRDEVMTPLGLTRTTYGPEAPAAAGLAVHPFADVTMPEVVQDLGAMAPAGQLWSTVGDLARWVAFVAGDTGDVLAASTMAQMRRSRVIADDPLLWQSGYGLGFQVLRTSERELVGHGGSVPGFLAFIAVDVDRGVGLVELANATSGPVFSGPDLLSILETYEPAVAPAWRPVDRLPEEMVDAVGIWHWGPAPFLLRMKGTEALDLSPAGGTGRGSGFVRRADSWVGISGYWRDERLRVVRRPDGTVSHLDIGTFVFTREPYDPTAPIPGGISDTPWSTPPSR